MTRKALTVVYDLKDGEIVHIHDYGTFGAELPIESQMEEEAIELAVRNTGRQKSDFAILHAQAEDMKQDLVYNVDIAKKSLVAKGERRRKR